MKMKQMAERTRQLEEGLAAQHAEHMKLAREHGVSVDEYHPLLQEHYTKIKKVAQNVPLDSTPHVDPVTREGCSTNSGITMASGS